METPPKPLQSFKVIRSITQSNIRNPISIESLQMKVIARNISFKQMQSIHLGRIVNPVQQSLVNESK